MNYSPDVSTPPAAAHSSVQLPPLLIAGSIVAAIILLLIALHFLIKKHHDTSPDDVKNVLNSIPVMRYTKNQPSLKIISSSECSVCISGIEEGEKVRVLPSCGHGFHAWCIDEWLETQLSCPVCRSAVRAPQVCVPMPLAAARAGKHEEHCSLPV